MNAMEYGKKKRIERSPKFVYQSNITRQILHKSMFIWFHIVRDNALLQINDVLTQDDPVDIQPNHPE